MATAKSKTMHADGPKFPATLERDYPVVAANLKTANLFLLQQVGAAMDLIVEHFAKSKLIVGFGVRRFLEAGTAFLMLKECTHDINSIDQIERQGPFSEPIPLSLRIHDYLARTNLAPSLIELLERLKKASEKQTYAYSAESQMTPDELLEIVTDTHFLARTILRLHGMGQRVKLRRPWRTTPMSPVPEFDTQGGAARGNQKASPPKGKGRGRKVPVNSRLSPVKSSDDGSRSPSRPGSRLAIMPPQSERNTPSPTASRTASRATPRRQSNIPRANPRSTPRATPRATPRERERSRQGGQGQADPRSDSRMSNHRGMTPQEMLALEYYQPVPAADGGGGPDYGYDTSPPRAIPQSRSPHVTVDEGGDFVGPRTPAQLQCKAWLRGGCRRGDRCPLVHSNKCHANNRGGCTDPNCSFAHVAVCHDSNCEGPSGCVKDHL